MEIVKEFHQLWDSKYALFYDDFYETYKQKYNDASLEFLRNLIGAASHAE